MPHKKRPLAATKGINSKNIKQMNISLEKEDTFGTSSSISSNSIIESASAPTKRRSKSSKKPISKDADFIIKVEDICTRAANKLNGRIIKHAIATYTNGDVDPSDRAVHFVATLLRLDARDDEEDWMRRVGVIRHPVQYLFQALTNFNRDYYDTHAKARSWMAEMVRELKVTMNGLIAVTGYTTGVCRTFKLDPGFYAHYQKVRTHNIAGVPQGEPISYRLPAEELSDETINKPAKLGYGFEHKDRLDAITVAAAEYMKQCTFRFAVGLYNDDAAYDEMIYGVLRQRNLIPLKDQDAYLKKERVLDHIFYALNGVKLIDEPQYHLSFNLQSSGRMHTGKEGLGAGLMALPKEYRREMVLPTRDGYTIVELDLKNAHIIFLCDIFGLNEHKHIILKAMDEYGSVWKPLIRALRKNPVFKGLLDSEIKSILKLIIYPYCLGGERSQLPKTANETDKNTGVKVTREMVDVVLGHELIKPIVDARDAFMSQYSVTAIELGLCQAIHTNALGMKFNVNKALEECKRDAENKKKWREAEDERKCEEHERKAVVHPFKVAKQLLSFYLIGQEQEIMQDFIVNYLAVNNINILCWSYDGVSVEIHEGAEEEFQASVLDYFKKWEYSARIDFEFGKYRNYEGVRDTPVEPQIHSLQPVSSPAPYFPIFEYPEEWIDEEMRLPDHLKPEREHEHDPDELYVESLVNDEMRAGLLTPEEEDVATIYKFPPIKADFSLQAVAGGQALSAEDSSKLNKLNKIRVELNKRFGTSLKPLRDLPLDMKGLITGVPFSFMPDCSAKSLLEAHQKVEMQINNNQSLRMVGLTAK